MKSPKVKVCGLTDLNQIESLMALKIDYLGFIFYPKSHRYVLNHLSLEAIAGVSHQGKVGVFVNEIPQNINDICRASKLNLIQLHGDESMETIKELRALLPDEVKIIKVIRVGKYLPSIHPYQNEWVDYLLFDTDSKDFGGTGKSFDWQLLNKITLQKPYVLSGGICEDNIHQAKALTPLPYALDINSKFEHEPGIKNLQKIEAFITQLNHKF